MSRSATTSGSAPTGVKCSIYDEPGVYYVTEVTDTGTRTSTWSVGERYTLIRTLGFGSFSCVCLATDNLTKEQVALKRIGDVLSNAENAKRVVREVCILRRLSHSNIIRLMDVFLKPSPTGKFVCRGGKLVATSVDIYMALEYCNQGDLFHMKGQMTELEVKHMMFQLLSTIKYLHECDVWHRDLKTANVLVTVEEGRRVAKLCDFGSARSAKSKAAYLTDLEGTKYSSSFNLNVSMDGSGGLSRRGPLHESDSLGDMEGSTADLYVRPGSSKGFHMPLTRAVSTPCYRAPEVVMSRGGYSSAIDMWSIGCIFGEMLQRVAYIGKATTPHLQVAPVFAITDMPKTPDEGEPCNGLANAATWTELNALFDVIGTPARACIEAVPSRAWRRFLKQIPCRAPKLMRRFAAAGEPAIDLLSRLLQFDPNRRCSAAEALTHEYFWDYLELQKAGSSGEGMEEAEVCTGQQAAEHAPNHPAHAHGMHGPSHVPINGHADGELQEEVGDAMQVCELPPPSSCCQGGSDATAADVDTHQQQQSQQQGDGASVQAAQRVPYYAIKEPAAALNTLEEELVEAFSSDNDGCAFLWAMLERECAAHASMAAQQVCARASATATASSSGGASDSGLGASLSQLGNYQRWEYLRPDPGVAVDPSIIGMERMAHIADASLAKLDAKDHLRAGRHGEWTLNTLTASVTKVAGPSWGVALTSPGQDDVPMDPRLSDVIRRQQAR